ncbi:MAG: CPXCG motif-containing cysteine-rich protein [Flavobacteriaceae bacterium]
MLLDMSIPQQTYIEDCEVCCNPIEVTLVFESNQLISFHSNSIEQ